MIRRTLRFIVIGFCLRSLFAAMGVVWLWCEYRRGQGYKVESSFGGGVVTLGSQAPSGRLGILVVCDWPGRTGSHFWSQRGADAHPFYWADVRMRPWQGFHLFGQSGTGIVFVRNDTGKPVQMDPGPDAGQEHGWKISTDAAVGDR